MTNSHVKKSFIIGLLLIVFFILPSIVPAEDKIKNDIKGRPVKIAIIPFQSLLPEEGSTTVVCPLCGGGYSTVVICRPGNRYMNKKIEKGAEGTLQESFIDKLRDFKEVQIIPLEKVAAVYDRIAAEALKKPLLATLKKAGAELQADVIVVGYIFRYAERVGYDFSAECPASVAFDIHLLDVKDGSTIWHGVFDKTQQSLMEDVFQTSSFIKGGGKWLTASQLAKQGINEIFKTFPGFEH